MVFFIILTQIYSDLVHCTDFVSQEQAHYIDFRLGDWVLSESFSSDVEDVPGTWGPKLPQRDDVVGYSPHFGFSYGAKSCETTQPYLTSILIQYLN